MSGHSHWHSIKHQKAITDAKRGKAFSKLTRLISIAAREKGGDPSANPQLRAAIEKAKEIHLPKENIERAIKRGTGELEGAKYEAIICEGYGPGGVAIMIDGITDNTNRTIGEVKQAFAKYGGKMGGEGSVKWMFERKGTIAVDFTAQPDSLKDKEALELLAIEGGAQDMEWHDTQLYVYTTPDLLESVKRNLQEKNVSIASSSFDWIAKEHVKTEEQIKNQCEKLFEDLDEMDDVQNVYSNLSF